MAEAVKVKDAKPGFEAGWLAPRYWPSWLVWSALRLIAWLPFRARVALGRVFGRALHRLAGKRREIAATNIALCFPELDEAERGRLVARHFEAIGIAAMEMPSAWWAPASRMGPLVSMTGREYLEAALDEGRGAILVSAHLLSMEVGIRLFSHQHYIGGVFRPNNNPVIDAMIRSGRSGHNGVILPRGDLRGVVRLLRSNRPVWYPPDQDHGAAHSVFAPFFGIRAATLSTTTRLARMSGAPVVPCYFHRLPGLAGYEIVLLPPLEDFPSGDEVADATRINALLEEQIRRSPEQYLWVHRRFKTRPEDEVVNPAAAYPVRRKQGRSG